MNGETEGLRRHSREQAAHAARRARDWAARQVAAACGPAPFVLQAGATARQEVTWRRATYEIAMRERQSKFQRGWIRIPQRTAPSGCVPICALFGTGLAILVVDREGRLCLSRGGKVGAVVTVSEAALIAGRPRQG